MGIQDPPIGTTPFDHETLTVAAVAVGLTAATYLEATRAEISVTTAAIRMWVDGTDPTATVGEPVQIGDRIILDSAAKIAGIRFIRIGGTSAELPVHYFH